MTATVDVEEVRSYRASISRGIQALSAPTYQRHETGFSVADPLADFDIDVAATPGKTSHVIFANGIMKLTILSQ